MGLRRNVKRAGAKTGRLLTAHQRALPNFLIIGARKAGTTSLYRYLIDTGSVIPAFKKEPFFFNRYYRKGILWYRHFFPLKRELLASAGQITGEASTNYLNGAETPVRVRRHLPDVRLIALLRDPVDRAISHYRHNVMGGIEKRSMAVALDPEGSSIVAESHDYLGGGKYAEHLTRWHENFDAQQILILVSEEFFAEPAAAVGNVLEHLEVEAKKRPKYVVYNETKSSERVDQQLVTRLREFYAKEYRDLEQFLERPLPWSYN